MAKLASLVVDLQVQSAQLRQGLDEANKKLDSFAKKTESAAQAITAAISFDLVKDAATGLANFIKSGADAADAMGKLATSVGVPVEELSRLAYAAELSGSSTEDVSKALTKTSEQMAKALSGSADQVAIFDALGISITDATGKMRSSSDVFRDIAQRFAETEDGTAKTALALQLFGEEGVKLIPLLNEGKEGLDRFGEAADSVGGVVTEKGAAGAAQFNKALKGLEAAGTGLATRVAQELAPSMAALAEEILNGKGSASAFEGAAKTLATAMRLLASGGVIVGALFEHLGKTLGGVASALLNLVQGDFGAAKESFAALGDSLWEGWSDAGKKLGAIWEESGPGAAMAKDAEKAKPSADALVAAIERVKKANEEREAAAKRAAEARKKAEEEAQKAAEKAWDEQMKLNSAILALDRQKQGIDRDVEGRRAQSRATAEGKSPTEGFASFDAALDTLAAELKAEATMRAKARELEEQSHEAGQEGRLIEFHNAELAAEAHKELAERASRAAAAFEEIDKARLQAVRDAVSAGSAILQEALAAPKSVGKAVEGVGGSLASTALGASPILGDVMSGASQGAAAGGPLGAVIGAVGGLLANSEGFKQAMESVNGILQMAADMFGRLFEYLQPLLDVVNILVENVLAQMAPALEALGMLFKGVAWVVGGIVNAIAWVWNGILDAVGWLLGEDTQKMKMKKVDLDAIFAPAPEDPLPPAAAGAAGDVEKLGDAARDAAESITNMPSWWKVAGARFDAAPLGAVTGAGSNSTTTIVDNSTHTYVVEGADVDEEELLSSLEKKRENIRRRRWGNRFAEDMG